MLQSLNLHQTGERADWEKIPQQKHNPWQKLAAATHGIITPANVISLVGTILTIIGLFGITTDLNFANVALIIIGRLADIADGFVAHRTGTKSPLGEIIDATVDKILAFAAVIALALGELAPLIVIIIVLAYSAVNSAVSATAKFQNIALHPSREGKLAGAACWGVISSYPLYNLVKDENSALGFILLLIAFTFTLAFVWYGWRSMSEYYRLVRSKKRDTKP